uniref:Si:ch211-133n4.6 n=1 Tax=Pygocentrus nattereri TaxID=42514 RepID=A0A3B4DLE9_PYGNA
MLTRNILIFCAVAVLLAEADLDAAGGGPQAMSTDQDSTSDEAPTESMNSVSPDQPNDEPQHYNGATADASSTSAEAGQASGPQVNDVTTAENESPESEEVVKAAPVQRAAKAHNASPRKRSKPVIASKKRTRPFRP